MYLHLFSTTSYSVWLRNRIRGERGLYQLQILILLYIVSHQTTHSAHMYAPLPLKLLGFLTTVCLCVRTSPGINEAESNSDEFAHFALMPELTTGLCVIHIHFPTTAESACLSCQCLSGSHTANYAAIGKKCSTVEESCLSNSQLCHIHVCNTQLLSVISTKTNDGTCVLHIPDALHL